MPHRGKKAWTHWLRLRFLTRLVLCWVVAASAESLTAEEPISRELLLLRQQLDGQSGVIDQLRRQSELQQRQLDELRQSFTHEEPSGLQVAEFVDRVPPASDGAAPGPRGLQYGYSDGFFVTSPDQVKIGAKDAPFTIKANVRMQLRHTYFNSDGPTRDENNFEFERAFLIFTGNVFTPDLAYHIKIDGDSDDGEVLDLLDAFATYDVGHALLECSPGTFGIKGGKWKMPFHRARYENGFNLQFSDRTMASESFDINRSIGAGLYGRLDFLPRPVNWEAAVFNGFQTQKFVPGRAEELDRNLATSVRLFSDVVGDYGKDGEPDLSFHDAPAVRIGAAFARSRLNKKDGLREFSVLRVVDTGATLASILPATVNEFDAFLYSVDANFKYRGLSLLSEYYFRSLTQFSGTAVPNLFDHGFMLQGGYFAVRDKLELLARWSRVVGDSSTLGLRNRSADEVAGGLAWYIRGQNLKLVSDVTHLNGATVNSTATNIRPRDDGWLFRTQFQIMF